MVVSSYRLSCRTVLIIGGLKQLPRLRQRRNAAVFLYAQPPLLRKEGNSLSPGHVSQIWTGLSFAGQVEPLCFYVCRFMNEVAEHVDSCRFDRTRPALRLARTCSRESVDGRRHLSLGIALGAAGGVFGILLPFIESLSVAHPDELVAFRYERYTDRPNAALTSRLVWEEVYAANTTDSSCTYAI